MEAIKAVPVKTFIQDLAVELRRPIQVIEIMVGINFPVMVKLNASIHPSKINQFKDSIKWDLERIKKAKSDGGRK